MIERTVAKIRPLFLNFKTWVIVGISSTICLAIALFLIEYTFPRKIHGPIIDRSQALKIAEEIAQQNNLNPADFQQAVSFDIHRKEEAFLELEYGQIKWTLLDIINKKLYKPYTWTIRHFKPAARQAYLDIVLDTTIQLTPDGKPYGFDKKIYFSWKAMQQQHEKTSMHEARLLAEESATKQWGINFNDYQLINAIPLHMQQEPSFGKWFHIRDYRFLYKTTDTTGNNIPFQLNLEVAGNTLSSLVHTINIPESFTTRYNTILNYAHKLSAFAWILILGLFFIGGCIGLYCLRKTRWIIWRQARYLALFLVIMMMFREINNFSLKWIKYDIFSNENDLYIYEAIELFFTSLVSWLFYTLIIAAGETFTRKAFPEHIQLWKTWSTKVAASPQILCSTLAGYFAMPFQLLYVLIWYLLVTQYGNWWISADPLIEPDIALHVPFISAAVLSLHAGIIEEFLFRAIPLAGAALLGERQGKRGLFIGIAFVVQIILFGLVHASYPSLPPYARLAELVVPASLLGVTYLVFGLYTAIIAHFTFDLFVFTFSDVGGAWWHQLLVLSIGLIPLIIVLFQRLRIGSWHTMPVNAYNAAWQTQKQELH